MMGYDFSVFGDAGVDGSYVEWLVDEYGQEALLHYELLWGYYCNTMQGPMLSDGLAGDGSESSRPYRQAQEYGLPSRITGVQASHYGGLWSGRDVSGVRRKEVVIENDIAWRIDTMVDFLFGKPISLVSRCSDGERGAVIEQVLKAVFDANGGIPFFQELVLLGSIYGFVDVILRPGEDLDLVRSRIESGLADFFAFDQVSFGQSVHFSDIVALLDGTRGVSHVRMVAPRDDVVLKRGENPVLGEVHLDMRRAG